MKSDKILLSASLALAVIAGPDLAAEEAPGDVYLEQPDGGALNTRTGKYYPPAGPSGVIDPETGAFFPKAGKGFVDPQTGDYYPAIE